MKLLGIGIGGSVIAGLCCVTPLLPWQLPMLGAGGLVGYVYTDLILYPVLAGILMLTGMARWQLKRAR